jgi:choline transport protein
MAELEKGTEPVREGFLGESGSVDDERRKSNVVEVLAGHAVNASGHADELQRHYGIWSLCGLALTIDNAWVALGGSIIVASGKVTQL